MSDLQPHQQRVVAEADELALKVSKLTDFLHAPFFDTIPRPEQILLVEQRAHMKSYLSVLQARITTFGAA